MTCGMAMRGCNQRGQPMLGEPRPIAPIHIQNVIRQPGSQDIEKIDRKSVV